MKKICISILLYIAAGSVGAVDMMHVLSGGYDAQIMTTEEMDSVLNGKVYVAAQNEGQFNNNASTRYRLEYENAKKLFRHSFFADYYLFDTQKNI